MDGQGELDRLGFDCRACQQDSELISYRGCGVPPRLDGGGSHIPMFDERGRPMLQPIQEWDGEAWLLEWYEHNDYPPDPLAPGDVWMHAGQMWVFEYTGDLWPWCPAWFSRFYKGAAVLMADRVLSFAGLAKRGLLQWATSEPPTPSQVNAVSTALSLMDRLQRAADDRAMQKIKDRGQDNDG